MISYRPFRNTDIPHILRIWRAQPLQRGRAPSLGVAEFEELVLAKTYFDRHGLIVACNDELPVGFVHAGFGPTDDQQGLSRHFGVISALLVEPDFHDMPVVDELLHRAESYLTAAGSELVVAGGVGRLCPFYLGLYGGSSLPGLLDSDPQTQEIFRRNGYVAVDRVLVLHRDLIGFRPPVDRTQLQIRRCTQFRIVEDPPSRNWWEACTLGCFDQLAVELLPRDGSAAWAIARFRSLGSYVAARGISTLGLLNIEVVPEQRRNRVATFLLAEGMRLLQERGAALIETQVEPQNAAIVALLLRLGFVHIDSGTVLQKSLLMG
ncbi:MAG: GNAT family N-acetyltransferase [Planctomycetia bacterium]|nr:GNAT family N-acetyltransferase [Planctomycetia bacterium]